MVQTRRQYNRWVEERGDNYHSTQEDDASQCTECSQRSDSNHFEFNDGGDFDAAPHHPQYRGNDRCKRHRLHDDVPKTERVVSYLRRK